MPLELIHKRVNDRKNEIYSGQVKIDQVLDDIFKVCYGKPKVSASDFLLACHTVDPNFAPISSNEERQTRAALTEKVRAGYRKQAIRELTAVDPKVAEEYNNQFGCQIDRHHLILFRGLNLDQQRDLAQKLGSGDKEYLRDLFVKQVLSKKDDLFALRSLSDADLADCYFEYADTLDLVFELQQFKDLDYTPEQRAIYNELFENMVPLKSLVHRLDVVANVYYADYPCERFEIKPDDMNDFLVEMRKFCKNRGEANGKKAGEVMGPTMEFVSSVTTLLSMSEGILDMDLNTFVKGHGATGYKDCTWVDESGNPGYYYKVLDVLKNQQILFVDIPGTGLKALRNAGKGSMDCRPVEATRDEVRAHMIAVAEKGVNRVDAANPFFLAKFTGSDQYNEMAAQHKAARELVKGLEFPLGEDEYQAAKEAVEALQTATTQYLGYKQKQGLKEDKKTGLLIGRSANERKRLAAAEEAVKLAETLNFLIQYQKSPEEASKTVQKKVEAKKAKLAAKQEEDLKSEEPKLPKEYQGDELSKSTKKDLWPKADPYTAIPPCQLSTAGPAMNTLQSEVPDAVRQLATFAGMKRRLSEELLVGIRANLARVVLFDYVLRERVAHQGEAVDGKVPAGPVEQALNDESLDPFILAKSPEFNKVLGTFTPARAEAFLNNDESRNKVFDDAVRRVLSPVKANDMANQPAQLQAQAEMNQPQAQPKLPKPVAMSGPPMG